jgi:DNA-binding LacI/PurR family transcriptional regulator
MTPKIRDIAKAANVSVTTVSHAISGNGRVAPETRDRVLRIALEMGYTANVHAQRLASGHSRTLGIQIACFGTDASKTRLLPDAAYFIDLLNGAASAAGALDYAVLLASDDRHPDEFGRLGIDGLILVDPVGDELLIKALDAQGTPVVTTGRPTRGAKRFPWVDNDHARVARQTLDHFASRGYSRPALVATTPNRSYVADIIQAYYEWTSEKGISPILVELGEPPTERAAAQATKRLLSRRRNRPDAIFATYDRLALGVLVQAQRLGVSVPGELAIASAVDSDALRWANPPITACSLNAGEIGAQAAQLVIGLVEGTEPVEPTVVVPAKLIARPSTSRRRPTGVSEQRRRPRVQAAPATARTRS